MVYKTLSPLGKLQLQDIYLLDNWCFTFGKCPTTNVFLNILIMYIFMLRLIYYIVIDGLEVYKSSGKCPRLKYMLHNWYKILDNVPRLTFFLNLILKKFC